MVFDGDGGYTETVGERDREREEGREYERI